eukprot:6185921-Pleurochrysis_carterae.AAC.1
MTLPLTTAELSPTLVIAANGRGNYGCASDKLAKSHLGQGVPMNFGVSTQHTNEPRKQVIYNVFDLLRGRGGGPARFPCA